MTYAPTYPNPGIQHTRCVLALTATQACLEVFRPAADCGTALKRQLDKISRWVEACAQQTRKKPLSAGATRDIGRSFKILGRYMITEDMPDETRFRRWRISSGLTPRDVAKEVGMSPSEVSEIENGIIKPTMEQKRKLDRYRRRDAA